MKRTFLLTLLAVLALSGSWFYHSRKEAHPNVVLVSIDTLRPDHLGCYGYDRETSPATDRLAREGVRFATVASTTSWTLPAHHALLTSLPDQVHGVLMEKDRLDENRITIAEVFRENGYRTGGVFTAPYLMPRFGFDQGYEDYLDATIYDKKLTGRDELVASERGRTTTGALDKAQEWLDRDPGRPFFLFLHLFDVHPDFDPPAPYDKMFDPDYAGRVTGKDVFHNPDIRPDMDREDLQHLISLYDGEIRYVDDNGVGRLVRLLEERDLLDSTLIVVTSDHGEEFFEHGRFAHHKNLYDTSVLVPLIIRLPGGSPGRMVVDRMVSIIDIMPTILDIAGLPQSPEGLGRSLLPLIKGKDLSFSKAALELTGNSYRMEGLRTDGYKIILRHMRKTVNYIDLAEDPGEHKGVTDPGRADFGRALDEFTAMDGMLRQYREGLKWGGDTSSDVDQETRERLESLGYINR